MKDLLDKSTLDIFDTPKKRGRPKKDSVLSSAERVRNHRAAKRLLNPPKRVGRPSKPKPVVQITKQPDFIYYLVNTRTKRVFDSSECEIVMVRVSASVNNSALKIYRSCDYFALGDIFKES